MLYQHIVDNCFQLINIRISGVWRNYVGPVGLVGLVGPVGDYSEPDGSHKSHKSYKSHWSHRSYRLVGLSVLFAVIEAGAGHLLAYASLGEKLLLLAVDESPQHICGLLNEGDGEVGRLFI